MLAVEQELTVYGDVLERVEVFKYFGRQMSMADNDAHAVCTQLVKACRVWARISAVLCGENASLQMCRMCYGAVVQSILLYGSKSWNICLALLA